jgi:LPXTG-motif cell wall-anchored protein
MRTLRQRLAAVTLIGGLATLGLGLSAGPASASRGVGPQASVSTCTAYLGEAQSGSLHLEGTPPGGTVPAGSDVSLAVSWDEDDFDEIGLSYLCATVDGLFNPALSSVRESITNDGSLTRSVSLPADLPGSEVCFIAALEGPLADLTPGEMTSETICYRFPAAATTTTTTTTTTTMAPQTEETVIEAGTPSAPAVEAAPVVEGEVADRPAPAVELPRTGESLDLLAGLGAVSLVLGGLARFTGRKRSTGR